MSSPFVDVCALSDDEKSTAEILACMDEDDRAEVLRGISAEKREALHYDFDFMARPEQREPSLEESGGKDWDCLFLQAGRGGGKTWPAAQIVHRLAMRQQCIGAVIAATPADARDISILGESGLLKAVAPSERPIYETSKKRLVWPNGSYALVYSGAEPEDIRGPNLDWAWIDELGRYRYIQETWDNLALSLRGSGLGRMTPKRVISTTPKPLPLFRLLAKTDRPGFVRRVYSMFRNIANLEPSFIADMLASFQGTRLGRQELHADILDDIEGALWTPQMIDCQRVNSIRDVPPLVRIVVAVDPSGTSTGDEAGIIVGGIDERGHIWILADYSMQASPEEWATKVISTYHRYQCDRAIGETNYGGDMLETTLKVMDRTVAFKKITASRGKIVRAEPVAALYERGMARVITSGGDPLAGSVHHVGNFAELEDEMCTYAPGINAKSPNRMDACLAAGTMVRTDQGEVAIEHVLPGNRVATRVGFGRVLRAECTNRSALVYELRLSNGTVLRGTGNHPIFTLNRGFVDLDSLVWSDMLLEWTPHQSIQSQSNSMESPTPGTQMRREGVAGCTTVPPATPVMANTIGSYLHSPMGRFLTECTSITRTRTPSTTTSPTSRWSPRRSMPPFIATRPESEPTLRSGGSTFPTYDPSPQRGMPVLREGNGTRYMGQGRGRGDRPEPWSALSAGRNSRQGTRNRQYGSVRAAAIVERPTARDGTRLTPPARFVAPTSGNRNTGRSRPPVPVRVVQRSVVGRQPVYNLEVEGEREYFANGILVHNCVFLVTELAEMALGAGHAGMLAPRRRIETVSVHRAAGMLPAGIMAGIASPPRRQHGRIIGAPPARRSVPWQEGGST